jgi:Domain of unknown function (DUF1963)
MGKVSAEPAIWFRRVDRAVSKSRLGGLPSLPEGIEWPSQPQKKVPFHFVGQIDLASLPVTPIAGCVHLAILPKNGILFFFIALANDNTFFPSDADSNPKGLWQANSKVVYAPVAGSERPAPHDLPLEGYHRAVLEIELKLFPVAFLHAYAIDLFVNRGDEHHFVMSEETLQSIEKATGEPAPLLADQVEFAPSYYRTGHFDGSAHFDALQTFGYPYDHNGEGRAAVLEGCCLLFQLPGHTLGMDESTLQFWIMPDDLAKRSFDKAWGTQEHM